ncbi:multidrug resistance protein MdtC [Striga asiatica]|uniref:Multidrug resistance protein MdtC n=1 Tax=Striga asiatica TaxID=4170 RepID=A0A5A7QGH5_STRAF|nr:multidrug resistance protein MdtC [Striga asiatica]
MYSKFLFALFIICRNYCLRSVEESNRIFKMCSKFLFALFIYFLAAPIFLSNSITLYGGAFLNAASIALLKEKNFTFLPLPPFFPPAPPPLFRAFTLSPFPQSS